MRLSTKGRYGTRVLLDLAIHQGKNPIALRDIAQRQEIPLSYLEHLISPLLTAGMIRSARGVRGGVWLAKPPEDVKLIEVIQLLEGPLALVQCVNDPKVCRRSQFCVVRDFWDDLKKAMCQVLESTTLLDLVERQKRKEQRKEVMYHI